ncbi:hypothetical protein BD408DRAFT_414832 [Parasitella parasitica]|nr:hypothetical protein BD408DRAFT_414832 [Parasitella parasitica]
MPMKAKLTYLLYRLYLQTRKRFQVQAFLPQLKTANECLENKDLSELDIENVNDEDGQYIEMNLGLGVYGEKKSEQSDSDDQDENSDNEKLIIPNGTSAGKPEKPLIEVIEK